MYIQVTNGAEVSTCTRESLEEAEFNSSTLHHFCHDNCNLDVDIAWTYMVQYEVQVMLDDLDTVIHMYSTTYNSSIYELTFW